jgi:hypothetical protein
MRRIVRHRRAVAALLATAIAVGAAAVAFSFWSGDGSGSVPGIVGSPRQLVLDPGTAQVELAPGDVGSVTVIATNPNPYFVSIPSLILDLAAGTGGFDTDAGHSGCDVSALHLAPQDNGGAGWRVPPRVGEADGSRTIELTGALSMDVDAATACQGAPFTVHLIASS